MTPTITPYGTPRDEYVVGNSDGAYFDIELSGLADGAEVRAVMPAGAEVHAWTGVAPLPWDPAGSEQPLLTGGAWRPSAQVGALRIDVSPGAAVTDPALWSITGAATGALRVRVRPVRAGGPAGVA